jgi:hypothetical protein
MGPNRPPWDRPVVRRALVPSVSAVAVEPLTTGGGSRVTTTGRQPPHLPSSTLPFGSEPETLSL